VKKKKEIIPYNGNGTEAKLIDAAIDMRLNGADITNAMFQHSVLCQAFLPYQNLGDEVTLWERTQGNASLYIQCLKKKHPETNEFITLGIPYGTRARLILAYINSQAVITQNPKVDVGDTMTAFIHKIGIESTGRNIADVKNQLARIAASVLSLTYKVSDNRTLNADFKLIRDYDLWFPKDDKQRIIWSSEIELSQDYFQSLAEHAIPLDERALAALSNNPMKLDVYAWLAQRLHRVPAGKPQFITWQAMKEQFGMGYGRMIDFKIHFREVLKSVKLVYPDANVAEIKDRGFQLHNSLSPIPKAKTFHFLDKPAS
jgi:hypothetical protein